MRITLDQFQTDYVTGLDSVVVGAQWLQDLLRERNRLMIINKELIDARDGLRNQNSRYRDKIAELEAKDKNIYILDTLA